MTKKAFFGCLVAALLLTSGHAGAAPRAPAPVSVDSWTGFYLNAGGGYGMWNANETSINPITALCTLCATHTVIVDNINFQPTVQTVSTSLVYQFNWIGH